MADTREPSMEEILASIRRIITEDGDPPPPAATIAAAAADADDDAPAADVLELTQPLPEDGADAGLLSETTAAVASQSLSALSGLVVRNYEGAEHTLEGLVREMLRPMLREWLDANLPELVERIVAREVERITRP
jgi:hypothetical protein